MKHSTLIKVLLFAPIVLVIIGAVLYVSQWLYEDWAADRSVLTNSPCAPPCWYGIVPGEKISDDEIRKRLHALPNYDRDWKPIEISVAWFWKQRPWRRTGYNTVTSRSDGVVEIGLWYDFELTVQQILEKYGLPSAVNYGPGGLPEHPYIRFNMHYPLRGLQFVSQIEPMQNPVLRPDTWVSEGLYTKPADSLDEWRQQWIGAKLQAWPGYGKLEISQP